MKFNELIKAISNDTPMVWDDPDPIEGNDYNIDKVTILFPDESEDIPDEDVCALIEYGGGSEATVYISEIKVK